MELSRRTMHLFWRLIVWAAVTKILCAQSNNSTDVCYSGPPTIDSNTIFANGKQYVSDTAIECSGFITAWNFSHYVIGFRDQETELWAGAWRIENDVYNLVGLNVMKLDPAGHEGGQFRYLEYDIEPAEWIEVREGDYIGYFVPENGVFMGSASRLSDPGHTQLQRSEYGYVENFNVSDLEEPTLTFGRALLGARIDPTAEKPATPPKTSIVPTATHIDEPTSSTSTPCQSPRVCDDRITMSSTDVALPVVAVVAVGIIVVLLAVITVLIVLLRRKRPKDALAIEPLPHPVGRAVDATNPATDNGNVVYETIQIQDVTNGLRSERSMSEAGYSMICNPAYGDGTNSDYTPTLTSPPVSNPTYTSVSTVYSGSLMRYPQLPVVVKQRTATFPGPVVPISPPPPDFPAPPAPYNSSHRSTYTPSKSFRPAPLSLKGGPPVNFPMDRPQSPPSPYSNPYKVPRPVDPDAPYQTIPPRTLSDSSTETGNSDQSSRDEFSASPTVSTAVSANTDNDPSQ